MIVFFDVWFEAIKISGNICSRHRSHLKTLIGITIKVRNGIKDFRYWSQGMVVWIPGPGEGWLATCHWFHRKSYCVSVLCLDYNLSFTYLGIGTAAWLVKRLPRDLPLEYIFFKSTYLCPWNTFKIKIERVGSADILIFINFSLCVEWLRQCLETFD